MAIVLFPLFSGTVYSDIWPGCEICCTFVVLPVFAGFLSIYQNIIILYLMA